jgi:hypothetical protein
MLGGFVLSDFREALAKSWLAFTCPQWTVTSAPRATRVTGRGAASAAMPDVKRARIGHGPGDRGRTVAQPLPFRDIAVNPVTRPLT